MIYITGDTHSDFSRFEVDKFPIQAEMTNNNYVIICADFGGVWIYHGSDIMATINVNVDEKVKEQAKDILI